MNENSLARTSGFESLTSILSCPLCRRTSEEIVPPDTWIRRHRCRLCSKDFAAKPGDCCVFCSYGSVRCSGEQNL